MVDRSVSLDHRIVIQPADDSIPIREIAGYCSLMERI
jgi:hypothetical protein